MNVIFHIEICGFSQKVNQTFYALFFAEVFEDAFDSQIRRIVCNTKLIRE